MLLFNRYQYEPSTDLIGKGEFTEVYEALDTHIYLPVAVKIYRAIETTEKFGFVQVDKFGGLDHPNICRYLHVGEIRRAGISGEKEKRQVCITELVKDGDFASYYQAHPEPELLRRMVLDILHGLTYLHSQRIVHRRLKPSNLLVGMTTQGPVVKITDFGLGSGKATLRDARISSMIVEVTRMAPEQFNPKEYGVDGNISYHIDFWGLGLAVYDALTGNDVLFKNSPGDSREQVIRNILSPRLPEKLFRLPAPFDQFMMRCLAKHADQRPQNTRELIELLSQPIATVQAVEPVPPFQPVQPVQPVQQAPPAQPVQSTEPVRQIPPTPPIQPRPTRRERPLIVVIPPHEEDRGPSNSAEDILTETIEVHPFFLRYEYDPQRALIGKGGFSRVYKAFDKKLDRWVALKFYKTGEYAEKYSPIAEIRRVINLDHPNICRYLDIEEIQKENAFGEKESTQVSVMELLDGGNLLEYYAAHPTKEVLRKLVGDVLRGLAYLHRNGIIHRDIKPANILIRETNEGPVAKITDFGVSKLSSTANTNSQSALVVSIPYMAPEQLNVKKFGVEEAIACNLDLWALGVTVYEVITGKVLFRNDDSDSNEEIMANILAPGLQDKIAGLPQPFLDIVRRCLVRDARRRVQGADELIELLNRPELAVKPAAKGAGSRAGVEAVAKVEAAAMVGVAVASAAAAGVAAQVETAAVVGPAAVGVAAARVQPAAKVETAGIAAPNQEAEGKREMRIPPELRLIPEPGVNTQDVFVPEKSWIWAEAVSAPAVEEPVQMVEKKTIQVVGSTGFRIAIIAATIVAILTSYIITQNNRLTEALHVTPQQTETVAPPEKPTVMEKAPALQQHHRPGSGRLHRKVH